LLHEARLQQELLMAELRFPLAGDVIQAFKQWFFLFSPSGGQNSFVTINMGHSPAPEVETKILEEVGTYGRQLGRIGDALEVLIHKLEPQLDLKGEDKEAVEALQRMLGEIRAIKKKNGR
jgi:hypothetical protein